MTGRSFVDSNILIYAHDADAGARHDRAAACLADLWRTASGVLSTQVLQEFYVNVTRKIASPLPTSAAREVVHDYAAWAESPITPATILRASEIAGVWQISFWDAMIVASAEQSRVARIVTEDLSHGERIAGIEILNPFL